jgi:tetratricopeptide (TPR) repeat protein
MDDKQDYASAIREFEEVLSIPENRDLVYKQFSVTYANLGHAYYESGNSLVKADRNGAATDLSKAILNLEKAKQNTRFFPAGIYDEAVHDTYYYTALAYHKLYLVTKKALLEKRISRGGTSTSFRKSSMDQSFASIRETQVLDQIPT